MQIRYVELKNVKSHREGCFHFSPGITVLSGPNGSGKSTLFEAIGYALFGVDARDFVGKADRFLSIGAKKGEVVVGFQTDDGASWRVSRSLGSGAKWLLARQTEEDFEVEEHANAQETETRLKELLGLSSNRSLAEQFKQIIGPFQHDFLGPFVIKSPTERQKAFDVTLGIDTWRQTYEGTSRLQSLLLQRIGTLNTEITLQQEQVAPLPDKVAEQKRLTALLEERKTLLQSQQKTLAQFVNQLQGMEKKKQQLDALTAAINQLSERLKAGEDKIALQKQRVAEAEASRTLVEETRSGKAVYDQAEERLKQLRIGEKHRLDAQQQVTALEKQIIGLRQGIDHETREVDAIRQQIEQDQASLQKLRQQLEPPPDLVEEASRLAERQKNLEDKQAQKALLEGRRQSLEEGREKLSGGLCPFFQEPCLNIAGKPAQDVFSLQLEDLDRQSASLAQAIKKLADEVARASVAQQKQAALTVRQQEWRKQLEQLEERRKYLGQRTERLAERQPALAELEQTLQQKQAALAEFANLDNEIAAAEQERSRHQSQRDLHVAHLQTASDLQARVQTLRQYEDFWGTLNQEQQTKKEELRLGQSAYDAEEHQRCRSERDRLLSVNAALEQETKGIGVDLQRVGLEVEKLRTIEAEIRDRQNRVQRLLEKEALVKFLRNGVFKQVSSRLSERFRHEISQRADRIYRTIAGADEELYWGENYQVILRDMVDGQVRERSDDQLSGGQTMSAVVSLRLALLQTIGARIAFFDEPTSNLDAERRENLAQAFRAIDIGQEEVTSHWYDQLFLVSHDVAFTEITDQVIELGDA